jgi:methylmalonyl-CoA decarboxylase subunit alpha
MASQPQPSMNAALSELQRRRALGTGQGGPDRIARQHVKGRLTARERIELLVDPQSFAEIGLLALAERAEVAENAPCDALIAGIALIDGRKVAVIAGDATVMAGSTGSVGGRKQGMVASLAARKGYPLVVLGDANGGRLPDFLGSGFAGVGGGHEGEDMFGVRVETDRIPRVTAVLGNAYGDPALWAAMADFVVMPETCSVALSGPELVAAATGEKTSHQEMGGPEVAAKVTGVVSSVVPTEADCMHAIRCFLSYLPSNSTLTAPVCTPRPPGTPGEKLYEIVPEAHNRAYDGHKVIDAIVDEGSFFELHAMFGRCLLTGLARIDGQPVGLMMNQPVYQAGILDAAALRKAYQLVDLCDAFGLALVFVQDLPGVMIGSVAERDGTPQRMADLYRRLAKAKVPKVTVIVRKAFGAGWFVMGGSPIGADYVCAWANAQMGFMAAPNSAGILHRRRIEETRMSLGESASADLASALESEMASDNAPWTAARLLYIHDVIRPEETREAVMKGLFIACGYR